MIGEYALRARPRLVRLPRPSPRLLAAALAVLALLAGGWLWLRDSSLVAVRRVTIIGVSGPDAGGIRSALKAAARTMTTLDVQMGQLDMAVAPYPVVKALQVSTQFPHGMRIRVIEQQAVGAVSFAGRTIAVAGDGTLLHSTPVTSVLPAVPLAVAPGGARLSDPAALGAVAVLAAAPPAFLRHISQVSDTASHGLVAQLRSGPSIYFGQPTRLAAKWVAVEAVLADSGSAGAAYIDVTDPQRPAAGAGTAGTGTSGAATAATTPTTPATTAATGG